MKIRTVVVIVVIAAGGYLGWRMLAARKAPATASAGKGGGAGGGAPGAGRAIAVVQAQAKVADVPIWLPGLGSVQAYNTVTVRPRVSGTLDEVNFIEGQNVKVGDVLARIDPRPYQSVLDQARARRAQDEAALANARRELARIRALVESEAEGKRLLEAQEATVAQAAAQLQGDDAAIAAAQLDLDFTLVRAPIAGRTGVRMIDAGNLVTANQSTGLVVITQLQPISVVFSIPQNYLPAMRHRLSSDPSPARVQALGDGDVVLADGKLELVDNQVDASTGTLKLKATFSNENFPLWPGQFVSARVLVDTRVQAVTVPAETVQPGLNGPFAYVIKPDQTVEARTLKVGPTVEGVTVVESGLKAGDLVVRDGQSKLQPGAKVMAAGGGGAGGEKTPGGSKGGKASSKKGEPAS